MASCVFLYLFAAKVFLSVGSESGPGWKRSVFLRTHGVSTENNKNDWNYAVPAEVGFNPHATGGKESDTEPTNIGFKLNAFEP